MSYFTFKSTSFAVVAAALISGACTQTAHAERILHIDANTEGTTEIYDSAYNRKIDLYGGVEFINDPWGGKALSFNGTSARAQSTWGSYNINPALHTIVEAGAIEFWYYRPTEASNISFGFMGWYDHLTEYPAGNYEPQLLYVYSDYGTNYLKGIGSNGAEYYATTGNSTTVLTNDEWTHVVLTWDATSVLQLYQNGALVGQTPPGYLLTPFTSLVEKNFEIGWSTAFAGTQFYQGYLDEISIWNETLDAGTIAARYQAGVDTMIPEPASVALLGLSGLLLGRRARRSIR